MTYRSLRSQRWKDLCKIPEVSHALDFSAKLQSSDTGAFLQTYSIREFLNSGNQSEPALDYKTLQGLPWVSILQSAFATSLTHCEARIASFLGKGFYTIGPGGEELMALCGALLKETDPIALHYRHVAVSLCRSLHAAKANASDDGLSSTLRALILARARSYCVSEQDPITGGVHCAIGGDPQFDFVVTSTLASQCAPALGRALGGTLINSFAPSCSRFPSDFVSLVSLGDGSTANGHFLSSLHLAKYARHRGFKCPLLFVITDNDFSISLRGYDFLKHNISHIAAPLPLYSANGRNPLEIISCTKAALERVRSRRSPAVLYLSNVPRRFGHAATDRQGAYLSHSQISQLAQTNPMEALCSCLVQLEIMQLSDMARIYGQVWEFTQEAFEKAATEKKVSREDCMRRVCRPKEQAGGDLCVGIIPPGPTKDTMVMRKHMTLTYDRILARHKHAVYIGEDIEHGGYYVVTEGLSRKYPHRVRDFPPDETTLLGSAMGFSHSGLLTVVEIPYAKYLDCAADMFYEAAIMSWLTNGRQKNGLLIRLQGFDRGVFGGNFHTTNMLHRPPGIDIVCYSNGRDYARGIWYAVHEQIIKHGRVVMTVDCTALLNVREWEQEPVAEGEVLSFDDVCIYRSASQSASIAIVSYGNGVHTALEVQKQRNLKGSQYEVDVIDCPLISDVPGSLSRALSPYSKILFADICKEGNAPLIALHYPKLRSELLQKDVRTVCAPATYNPLGSTCTFLNTDDIEKALNECQS